MEVVLERDSTEESWGLVWHVQGYKAQNLGFSNGNLFFFGCRCLWGFFEVILDHLLHFHLGRAHHVL